VGHVYVKVDSFAQETASSAATTENAAANGRRWQKEKQNLSTARTLALLAIFFVSSAGPICDSPSGSLG
jgi:hypothetical protein